VVTQSTFTELSLLLREPSNASSCMDAYLLQNTLSKCHPLHCQASEQADCLATSKWLLLHSLTRHFHGLQSRWNASSLLDCYWMAWYI